MHSIDDDLGRSAPAARSTRAALACAVALTLAAPLAASAAEAMREVRDPVTGEMRGPTAAEAAAYEKAQAQLRQSRALSQSRQASTPGATPSTTPTEIQHADGSVETKLDEDTIMYSVVRANEDGSLSLACLPGKQAQAFVKPPSKKTSFAAKPTAKAVNAKQ